MAADAIEAWIDAARAFGRAVPLPRAVDEELSGRFVLRIARGLHAKLVRVARREGVSLNAYCATALAEAVGTAEARHAYAVSAFAFTGVGETRPNESFNMTVPVGSGPRAGAPNSVTVRVGSGSRLGASVAITTTTGKVLQ